ncbi:MAG: hypothetical protein KDB00_12580 [Planctomycetales bacterium]|nr:hypothetical protein [Planctomycetales bacterium]
MEDRQLLSADLPYGATPIDTGEFLLGTVTVTPVFFESDGSIDPQTQNWTAGEIDATLVKIRESVDWWSDLLATQTAVHTLDFVIDDTYAIDPVETGYEPIDRSSTTFQRYVGDWLTDLGYGDAPSIERAVSLFNDSQRQLHGTDWAFTIFVVDSSDDGDGFFPSGYSGAFAYPGGLFIVIPSERPASTYSHEMGHIFWARDEYPGAGSWEDRRGYYNAQNLNAADNPTPGFVQEDSIMRGGVVTTRAYDNLVSPESTLAMIGWRDSDGDGIFDLADVPLVLDALGSFDIDSGIYTLKGSAAVDTLINENSEGNQSDITLARISKIQYKLDDGAWQDALAPDATNVDFDLQIPIPSAFDQIQWRAIDTSTGIASETLVGDSLTPVFSGTGGGFAYLDENASGGRNVNEMLISGTQFTVRRADGSDLFHQSLQAGDFPDGPISPPQGMSISSVGSNVDGRVAAMQSTTIPAAGRVLNSYDTIFGQWTDTWSAKRKLDVAVAESTGHVEIDFTALDTGGYGVESGSYARAEVFDAQGNRIDRVTSQLVAAGQSDILVLNDSQGRIARVVIYGHAETEILISSVRFGQPSITSIDDGGAFSVDGLPDGQYSVQLVSPNLIYQFAAQPIPFEIAGGTVAPIAIAAAHVDSPRYNSALPGDVNGDGSVTVRDALVVINDLGRLGNRVLGTSELTGFDVDVSNDGRVSAIDALRVINLLEQGAGSEGEQISGTFAQSPQTSEASPISNSTQAPFTTQAAFAPKTLTSAAVDGVFADEMPQIEVDRNKSSNREKPEMLNSAGQRTSGQSHWDSRSDTSLGADVQLIDGNGAIAGQEHPIRGFLRKNGEIATNFAANALSDKLF